MDEAQTNAGATLPAQDAAVREPVAPIQPPSGDNSKLAGILAKKANGEKLSKSEIGYLGGIRKKKVAPIIPVASSTAANPLLSVPPNPANPLLAPQAAIAPAVADEAGKIYNTDALRKTADGICGAMDGITKFIVGNAARKAGGNDSVVEKYRQAVSLRPENRSLIVEGSEPAVTALCKALNVEPEKLDTIMRSSGLVAGLGAHCSAVMAALEQIKQDRLEHEKTLPAMAQPAK